MPDILSVQDFAGKIKAKYPEYKDMDDLDLATKIVAKHPEYKDKVSFGNPTPKEYQNFGVKTSTEPVQAPNNFGIVPGIDTTHPSQPAPVSNTPVTDQGTPLNSELPQDHYPGFTNQDAKKVIYGNVPGSTKIGDTNVTNNAFNQNLIDSKYPVSDNQKQLDQTPQAFEPTAQIQANTANKTTNPATVVPQVVNPVSATPVSLDKGNQSVDDNLQGVHVAGGPGTYTEAVQRYGIDQAIDEAEGDNPGVVAKVAGAVGKDASKSLLRFGAGTLDLAGTAFGFLNNLPSYLVGSGWKMPKTDVQKTLQDAAANLKDLSQTEGNKDITQLFKEKNYVGAVRKTAQDVVEGLPIMIAAMGTGGLGGAVMFGADAYQNKYDELRESNISEDLKRTNALFSGLASGGTLALATGAWTKEIAPTISGLIDKYGVDKAKSEIATKAMQYFSNVASKSGVLNTPVLLGLQAGADRFAANGIDNATGVKSGNMFEGVGQSFFSGMGTGIFFGGKEALEKIPEVRQAEQNYTHVYDQMLNEVKKSGFTDEQATEELKNIRLAKEGNDPKTLSERDNAINKLAVKMTVNSMGDRYAKGVDSGLTDNVIEANKNKIKAYLSHFDVLKDVSFKAQNQLDKEGRLYKSQLQKDQSLADHQTAVAKKQQDIEAKIRKDINPDTNSYMNAPVFGKVSKIVGGKIIFNEDGTVDTENSDKSFHYIDENGEDQITSTNNIGIRTEDIPAEDAVNQAKQGVTAPLQAKFENSQVRPYTPGESATIDFKDGTYDFGQIQGVNQDGTYQFVGSRGPQNIEPRSIVNEDNLQGVNNGDLVNYTDQDGQLKQGVYQFDPTNKDDLLLRTQGNVFINDQAIPVKDVQPIKKEVDQPETEQKDTTLPSQDSNMSEVANNGVNPNGSTWEEIVNNKDGIKTTKFKTTRVNKAGETVERIGGNGGREMSWDEFNKEFEIDENEKDRIKTIGKTPKSVTIHEIREGDDGRTGIDYTYDFGIDKDTGIIDTRKGSIPVKRTPVTEESSLPTFKSQIPVQEVKDAKGNVKSSTTLYEQVPVETTIGALKESFDPETVPEVVGTTIKNTQAQIDKLNKTKLKGNIDEMDQQNAVKKQSLQKLNDSLDYWNKVNEALKPKEEPEKPVETNNDYYKVTAQKSDDISDIKHAYDMAMTESEYETLLPWQEDLLSRKIHPDSFKEAGDRNYMNDVKAWLTPKKTQRGPSNSIDTIAEELSGHGVEVTPDMIVDFMKDHPSMRVQRGSEFTRDLNDRFSKVASKIAGTDIHGIDSPSGKVFLATYNGLKDKSVTLQDPTDQELGFVDSLPMEDNEDEYAAIKQVIDNTDPEELNNYINSEHEKDRIAKENVGVDAPGQDKEPGEGSKGIAKPGELKGITVIEHEDDGKTLYYGSKSNGSRISVKGMSLEDIASELKFEKDMLKKSKKEVSSFDEKEIMNSRLTLEEKDQALKMQRQSILNNEQVEKIVIPFYESHLNEGSKGNEVSKRIGMMDNHPSYTPHMNELIKEAQDNGDLFPYSKMIPEEQHILDKAFKDKINSIPITPSEGFNQDELKPLQNLSIELSQAYKNGEDIQGIEKKISKDLKNQTLKDLDTTRDNLLRMPPDDIRKIQIKLLDNEIGRRRDKSLTNSMDDFEFKDEDVTKAKKKCIPRPKGGFRL